MRFPWTIWRHVFLEMWRLLLLTTGVLVMVMAFAITVRFTAEGKLGPLDTLKFMSLAMVPMLQYVLPFAAGFGATLTYHRMTQDNELTAAKASGVSHRALLVPALLTGLILSGVLGVLNGNVIPRFLRSMDDMITQDAAKMVEKTIEAGQPLIMGKRIVSADQVYRVTPEQQEKDGPYEVLLLTHVSVIVVGPTGEVTSEITAAQALLSFFAAEEDDSGDSDSGRRGGGGLTTLAVEMKKAYVHGPRQSGIVESQLVSSPIAGVFNDDPKYYTNRELAEIPGDPDRINVVDTRRRELAFRLAERETMRELESSLRTQGQARMTDSSGRTFAFRGSGLRYEKPYFHILPPGGEHGGKLVEVDLYRAGAKGQPDPSDRVHLAAESANLRTEVIKDATTKHLQMALELENVTTSAREGETTGNRLKLEYNGLTPKDDPLADLLKLNSAELLKAAAERPNARPDDWVADSARTLRLRIAKLKREVLSKQHERAAMSVACLVMVLTGALTAMRLAHSLPLTVYLWSFFPALAAVITVSAGQNVTHQIGTAGLALLWGGVAALAVYTVGAFWLVRKH